MQVPPSNPVLNIFSVATVSLASKEEEGRKEEGSIHPPEYQSIVQPRCFARCKVLLCMRFLKFSCMMAHTFPLACSYQHALHMFYTHTHTFSRLSRIVASRAHLFFFLFDQKRRTRRLPDYYLFVIFVVLCSESSTPDGDQGGMSLCDQKKNEKASATVSTIKHPPHRRTTTSPCWVPIAKVRRLVIIFWS